MLAADRRALVLLALLVCLHVCYLIDINHPAYVLRAPQKTRKSHATCGLHITRESRHYSQSVHLESPTKPHRTNHNNPSHPNKEGNGKKYSHRQVSHNVEQTALLNPENVQTPAESRSPASPAQTTPRPALPQATPLPSRPSIFLTLLLRHRRACCENHNSDGRVVRSQSAQYHKHSITQNTVYAPSRVERPNRKGYHATSETLYSCFVRVACPFAFFFSFLIACALP